MTTDVADVISSAQLGCWLKFPDRCLIDEGRHVVFIKEYHWMKDMVINALACTEVRANPQRQWRIDGKEG
jgi:hypothetical protein